MHSNNNHISYHDVQLQEQQLNQHPDIQSQPLIQILLKSPLLIQQKPQDPLQPPKPHPKSKFTLIEDQRLRNLVHEYGESNWRIISENMGNRSVRQCKERWTNYLSPNISNDPWSKEEDDLLEQKYIELGPKWVKISQFFPKRTDSNVKNRWLVLSRRLKKEKRLQVLACHSALQHVYLKLNPEKPKKSTAAMQSTDVSPSTPQFRKTGVQSLLN
ncbi:Myb-like DNA-binding domain containing protein [Tritrichomonas foetus]|uniref:Myb-like DNA-binding domain containing protein n=1 Tax=Tritrichomonas foetus TaxID=1144522 RepID=A0A1J4KI15_9EUKA|nr:Myb-like DNA-binding domain containing protein [Tritrichomonas foetus]|eukprot:OHT09294.1 Myb-like DNA-binding domain containing protein [Tritrichomonas foetus]